MKMQYFMEYTLFFGVYSQWMKIILKTFPDMFEK